MAVNGSYQTLAWVVSLFERPPAKHWSGTYRRRIFFRHEPRHLEAS